MQNMAKCSHAEDEGLEPPPCIVEFEVPVSKFL